MPSHATPALDAAQLRAVESDAARLLILAGAGSGKTRTLTHRVARLLTDGVPPSAILVATFTNRAAQELSQRLEALAGPSAKAIRTGTFHALAHQTLRTHAAALGFEGTPGVINYAEQRALMAASIASASFEDLPRLASPDRLLELLSAAINHAETVESAVRRRAPRLAPRIEALEAVFDAYARRKASMNVMDFDDLLLAWRSALAPGHPLELRRQLRHVLVDEYQDTNLLQAELTEALTLEGAHLCVVGDDAQAIFGFRGARVENILEFERRAPTEVHLLVHNYRSEPWILDAANAVIRHNRRQHEKRLIPKRPRKTRPAKVAARDAREEARFVVQRILELHEAGVPFAEQAVLYRAHAHARTLELELRRRNVPYRCRLGARVLERPRVRELLTILRVLAHPADALCWRQLLASRPGIGPSTVSRLLGALARAEARGIEPLEALAALARGNILDLDARAALSELVALLRGLPVHPQAILRALSASIPRASEDEDEEYEALERLAARHVDLVDFLAEVALANDATADDEPSMQRVTLSTVHQAKGLEWRAVFVIGLTEGAFPLRLRDDGPDAEEEERRLFYVALTRARDELYLCWPTRRNDEALLASRFIRELPDEFVETWTLEH